MSAPLVIVRTQQQAVDGIRAFNDELLKVENDHPIVKTMAFARAWYAFRHQDGTLQFGPSKFIGYCGNTAELYAEHNSGGTKELDGRATEKELQKLAEPIQVGHPVFEEAWAALNSLCAKHGLTPSRASRMAILPPPLFENAPPVEGDEEHIELLWGLISRLPKEARQVIGRRIKSMNAGM